MYTIRQRSSAQLLILLLALTAAIIPGSAQNAPQAYTISTVAGSADVDGEPGPEVALNLPEGVTLLGDGTLLITENSGARVRALSPDGAIRLVAGTGVTGFGGDGGPATEARLNNPRTTDVDAQGNLYIGESQSSYIRIVSPDGTIRTYAGGGGSLDFGIPATQARLQFPDHIALAPDGTLYFSSWVVDRVYKITPAGILELVAGTGVSGFSGDGGPAVNAELADPQGVGVDANGILYIADGTNNRIRRVGADGIIQTVVGGGTSGDDGPALETRLTSPQDVEFDAAGTMFIVEPNRIRKLLPGGMLLTVARSTGSASNGDGGPATAASFRFASQVALAPDGGFYFADPDSHNVRYVNASGIISTVAGNGNFGGDGGPATESTLFNPQGLVLDGAGGFYITDTDNHRIRRVNAGGSINTVAGDGTRGSSGDGGPASEALFALPRAIDRDAAGNIFIADSSNSRIRKIDASGAISTIVTNLEAYGLAVDRRDGSVYAAEAFGYRLHRILPGGADEIVAGTGTRGFSGDGGPATAAQIDFVAGIAVDQEGNVFLADNNNHRIRKIDTSGVITTVAGSAAGYLGDGGPATEARLLNPYDVTVTEDGTLLIADTRNAAIRMVTAGGVIHTIAGQGAEGSTGDGGPATLANLYYPTAVEVDDEGNIFIADALNHRIRKLTPGAIQTGQVAIVNAANGAADSAAPGSIISAYGENLAAELLIGNGTVSELGGASVEIVDSIGNPRPAGLYFVSAGQINCVIPAGASTGLATVIVRRNGVGIATAEIRLESVSPALFSANNSGTGVAAAVALTIPASGERTSHTLADGATPTPVSLGSESDAVYLLLFGTGVRGFGDVANIVARVGGVAVPILGAAAQTEFPGLDQVNIGPIPRSLIGSGEVEIALTVRGVEANRVTVVFQ
ncbi:MAG: hypothetical protein WD733_01985 [Bryobacterales bacterium]